MKQILDATKAEMCSLIEKVQSKTATEAEGIRLSILTSFLQELKNCNDTWPGVLPVS